MIIEKNVYLQLHAVPVKAYNFFLSFEVELDYILFAFS